MSKAFILSDEVLKHEIRSPAYDKKYIYNPKDHLNDLELFTNGQPFDLYKDLRLNAPVFFHDSMLNDPEPGYWVLTKYDDIKSFLNNYNYDLVEEFEKDALFKVR